MANSSGKSIKPTCGAKTRSGSKCKKPAGWGTNHVGEGRCKLHGGASTGPIKHGRYSLKHRQSLAQKAQQFLSDATPGDLTDELALMRALLQDYLDRFPEDEPLPIDAIERIIGWTETISKLVERIAKILSQTALTQAELELLVVTIADLVVRYVDDPAKQVAFIREAQTVAGRLGADRNANQPIPVSAG